MTDRRSVPEPDRLAIAAEVVELLLKGWTQPQLAEKFRCTSAAVGKAIRGDVGAVVADLITEQLKTTRAKLRIKHADVLSGKSETPMKKWARMGRKRGSRGDLLHVAGSLDLEPLGAPELPAETVDGAVHLMVHVWKHPPSYVDALRKRYTVTDATIDSVALAQDWERLGEALRLQREQSEEPAEAPDPAARRSSRPGSR